jgi:hypothetical protein
MYPNQAQHVTYLNVVKWLVSVPRDKAADAEQVAVHALGAPMAHTVLGPAVAAASIGQVRQAARVMAV